MKKNIVIILLFLLTISLKAQETTPEDAIRYAVENLNGSARFRAMSGAFGAVGGDLSAINQNPAGSIFFNNNYATVTASGYNSKNSSNYFGNTTKKNNSSFDVNQLGAAFVFTDRNPKNNWKKIAVAFNYENNNNFDNSIYSAGINPSNSIDKYFLRFANGLPQEGGISLQTLQNANFSNLNFIDQQAFLGYQAYIFNPVDANNPQNTLYGSNVPTNENYFQDNYSITRGYDSKVTGNISAAFKDKIILGFNFNYHYTDLIKTTSVYESYNTPDNNIGLQSVQFDNETHTFGNGISFNFGAIFKATNDMRIGLSYKSPTWYRLQDEQSQAIFSDCPDCSTSNPIIFNPRVTMIYLPYNIQTPSKWTTSFVYIFGKKGLFSADISQSDFSKTRLKPKNDYAGINSYLNSALHNAIEVRLGGEYKFKQMSFRGGYRFEQSPYKVDRVFGDLTGYSGGLGYNFGENRIDIAYSYEHRNFDNSFLSSGMTDTARISRYNNNITLSYSVNF